jgi:HlyD family secretion protein
MAPDQHPPQKPRARMFVGVVVVAAVGCGVAWAVAHRQPAAPRLETAVVDKGDIVSRVSATGALSAVTTVQIGAQVSGRIAELHADFNTPVKKGVLLARLDPQQFEASVKSAQANLAVAEAALVRARANAEQTRKQEARLKELVDKNLVAVADVEAASAAAAAAAAEVASSTAQIAQARANLERAQADLGYTKIYSPIDGVVLSRAVDVGQTVAASLQAPVLFTIAENLAKMQVDTDVSEADVGRIKEGQSASFTVDAFPGERFHGRVRQVRNAAEVLNNVVTYAVMVDVDNADGRLRPGMTATVTFVAEEADDVVRVPNAALRYRPAPKPEATAETTTPKQKKTVTPATPEPSKKRAARPKTVSVLRPGALEPEQVPVVTGLSDGSFTEVKEGLSPGDVVVTGALEGAARPAGSTSLIPSGRGGRRGY